ncbi:MAG: hypothetical protein K0S38_132 [Candidatus Paceibacter sp.]|nr:hypothetical protein [Candidatus Paceibacter sp.]
MNISINWKRAELLFGTLLTALKQEAFPYDFAKPPQRQENLPRNLVWGSLEHSWFLFCVCYYMRGGIKSDRAIRALARMYEECPSYFNPETFVWPYVSDEVKIASVKDLLQRMTLNYKAGETSIHWVRNFQKLVRFWNGDPRKLFDGVTSYQDICDRLMHDSAKSPDNPNGYFGFRNKMVSMLTHFYLDAGIVQPFPFQVPVDFHVLRMMISHGAIVVDAPIGTNIFSLELLATARKLSQEYCQKHNVDPLRLGDALWLLSSNLCWRHPGNRTLVKKLDGRKSILGRAPVTWSRPQVDAVFKSCEFCPVAKTCQSNIPAAEYYIRGQIVIVGPRLMPSHQLLFR